MLRADFATVLWKEWKEILLQRSAGGGGLRQPLIVIAILGIFVPLRMGPQNYFSPEPLLIVAVLSAVVISVVVADAFAGERERHTLETLLASRLSDRAILFGKIAACVGYGWVISLVCIALGVITVNATHWSGRLMLFHDAQSWLLLLLGPPLAGLAMASAGVFISLHSATVRQAQQTLGAVFAVVFFGLAFGASSLPAEWKAWFVKVFFTWTPVEIVLLGAGVFFALDLLLVLAAMARFQRSRLVLD